MNPIKQHIKVKKYKKKRLRTKEEENRDVACCIKQLNNLNTVTPLLDNLFIPFLNKKDYTAGYLKKRRQQIITEVCKDMEYVSIPTVIVTKRKWGGVEKSVAQKWHHILVSIELILEWYSLEPKEVLMKTEANALQTKTGNKIYNDADKKTDIKMIIRMFRNKFFTFFDSGKALHISGEHKFMKMCIKRTQMLNGYIIKLKKENNKNGTKLEGLLEDKRKQIFYDIRNKIQKAKNLNQFIDDVYTKINAEYEKSNKEVFPKYPSIEELEKQCEIEKKSSLVLTEIPIHLNKINIWVINQVKRVLNRPSIKKIRGYKWRSNIKTEFGKKDLSRKLRNLRFETLKIKNNSRAMEVLSKFMCKNNLNQTHRFVKFTKIVDGKTVNVWNSEIDKCRHLITPSDMKRQIFKWLKFILRKDRKKYFEFLETTGITRVKKYKKIKGSLEKEQWYHLMMLGYKQLLYG